MQATATTSLVVENFFIGQRSRWPNPYALQYAHNWATAVLIEAGCALRCCNVELESSMSSVGSGF